MSFSYYGTDVRGLNSVDEVMSRSGLDYLVEKAPLEMKFADGTSAAIDNMVATYRSDTNAPLGVVSPAYQPLQNRETFDWMQQLSDEGDFKFVSACEYHGGRKIALTCELPERTVVGADDEVTRYLIAVNNHDGGGSCRLFPSSIRAVCENTLRIVERNAEGSKTILRMIHRESSLAQRVSMGRDFLGSIRVHHNHFQALARVMNDRRVTDDEVTAYFKALAALKTASEKSADRAVEQMTSIFHNEKNEGKVGATGWALFNAATEWSDHGGRKRDGEKRVHSNLFGDSDAFKQRALTLAEHLFVAA